MKYDIEKILFSEQLRECMMVTALEGGSNYWLHLSDETIKLIRIIDKKNPLSIAMWNAIKAGQTLAIHDIEEPDEPVGKINLESIQKAEILMIENHLKHYADARTDQMDAITGDVWFQLACFGEIIYG